MLGVDGVGDRRSWAILARNFSVENWERQEERKRSKKVGRERASKQPSSTAETGDCDRSWTSSLRKGATEVDYQVAAPTEMRTPNLHRAINRSIKECGWKDGDRGGPAQMQNLL